METNGQTPRGARRGRATSPASSREQRRSARSRAVPSGSLRSLAGVLALASGCADVLGGVDIERSPEIRVDIRPIKGSLPERDAGACDTASTSSCAERCTPDVRRCDGKLLQRCNDTGQDWELIDQCASQALCDTATGCQTPACAPQQYHCTESGELQICKADQTGFEFRDQCRSGAYCSAVSGREGCEGSACRAGRLRCNGAQIEQCLDDRSGFVAVGTPCASASLCKEDESENVRCVEPVCKPGQFRCSTGELQRCADERDEFVTVTRCLTAELCHADLARCGDAVCLPAEQRCTGSTLERCNASQSAFSTVAECGSPAQCDQTQPTCLPAPPVVVTPPPPPVLGTEPYTFVETIGTAALGLGPMRLIVPTEWTDVDMRPWSSSSGLTLGPRFIASTDTARFSTYYDIPGVYFAATASSPVDVAARLAEFDVSLSRVCSRGASAPYTDQFYTGTSQTYLNCGGTGATTVVVASTPDDGRFICIVIVTMLAERDQEARDQIWLSFEVE